MSNIRSQLIDAGVRNLKQFGYPDVSAENILTDGVYSGFFKSMLNDNLGRGFDTYIKAILAEIDSQSA